jgi:N-acetylneuraminate synthase/N,N'-diacetyllegionaminate synthase
MASIPDIRDAINKVKESGNNRYALLHCAIGYPPPMADLNLSAIAMMSKKFSCPIGYSDHTLGITIPIAAVAMGAKIIEKHFTLDNKSKGPDHGFSLSPSELKEFVYAIRSTERAMGMPVKKVAKSEIIHLLRGRRSLFARKDIRKGDIIDGESLIILRPASGIMPKFQDRVIGKKAKRDILKNEPVTWNKIK